MLREPIKNSYLKKFDSIKEEANAKCKEDFSKLIESIKTFDDYEKVTMLHAEGSKYIEFENDSDLPYSFWESVYGSGINQYINRTVLLGVDESNELLQESFNSNMIIAIGNEIKTILNTIPKFTLKQFIQGQDCKFFSNFNYGFCAQFNIVSDDYHKIEKWQTNNLISLVNKNLKVTIDRMLKFSLNKNDWTLLLRQNIDILNKILDLDQVSEKNIHKFIAKLSFIELHEIEKFEPNKIISSIHNLNKLKFEKNVFNVEYFNYLEKSKDYFLPNEIVLAHLLLQMLNCFEPVYCGFYDFEDCYLEIDFESEFKNAFIEVEQEVQDTFEEIRGFESEITQEEYINELLELFNYYRNKFKESKNKEYFTYIKKGNLEPLITIFTYASYLDNYLEYWLEEAKDLYRILYISNIAWDLLKTIYENSDFFKKELTNHSDLLSSLELLDNLIFDVEDYRQIEEVNRYISSHNDLPLFPLEFHFMNMTDAIDHAFRVTFEKFQIIFDTVKPNNKVVFIQNRLREIKIAEINERLASKDKKIFRSDFVNLFKEFLETESSFLREMSLVPSLAFSDNSKYDTFESFVSKRKQEYILKLLEDLSITNEGEFNLGLRKKGAIRGIVIALREKYIIPNKNIKNLSQIIGSKIGLEINSKLDWSYTSDDYENEALEYINTNPYN